MGNRTSPGIMDDGGIVGKAEVELGDVLGQSWIRPGRDEGPSTHVLKHKGCRVEPLGSVKLVGDDVQPSWFADAIGSLR